MKSIRRSVDDIKYLLGEADEPAKPIAVGDILVSTWGYDQTNVDFYKVVKRNNTALQLVKLDKKKSGDWMMGTAVPGSKEGGVTIRKKALINYDGGEFVKINKYAHAYPWNGKPVQYTGGA